ncbi:hypothetical protein Droror1_Dr00024076 [Drosera rotundifolia]
MSELLVDLAIALVYEQQERIRNRLSLVEAGLQDLKVTSVEELSGQTCQICWDAIEFVEENEILVACNECAFPVCRACYEYERREGTQACPQCKTRYKRLKGPG